MSTCHASEEFAEAGALFQQQGQATCQISWEMNGAQFRKKKKKHPSSLRGENMYYICLDINLSGVVHDETFSKSDS